MTKVLYLSYDGMTDPLGQSQVIPYLERITKFGYHFTLISFEKNERFKTRGKYIQSLMDDRKIHWVPLIYHKLPPVLSTVYDLWVLKRMVVKLNKQHSYSLIHCRSYITALIGLYMKKRGNKIRFIFDMRGFWADERIEGGMWNTENFLFRLIYRYFKRKEKEFLERADYTISLTYNAKKEIHSWNHIQHNPIPIQVIPCCADLEIFDRRLLKQDQLNELREKLSIEKSGFVLLYLGSLGSWYMIDEMLCFFKQLLLIKPKAKFLILTKDTNFPISNWLDKMDVDDSSVIVKSAERNEIPLYISLASCSLFFLRPTYSKKATSPVKQGEIMGMGVPIICNGDIGDTGEIIRKTGAGIVVSELSEASYRRVCRQLDELLKIDPVIIRKGAEQFYALDKGVEAYRKIYEKLLIEEDIVRS